ncbi:IS3 family transposase [Rhodococcoides fascians]|uniref:IS3 family transposase n=1 Tax=Rhodococcoides fascians TaxID=1828 RepID=UPI000AE421A9|nr:IS3 family transposase [Rhodococcus fascians]
MNTINLSKRLACRAVGLARSTYARTPIAETPANPDAAPRASLRQYARTHPLHGFRRAWAHLRHDQGVAVNKKKVHRLWKEERLQVRIYHPRKRAGISSCPQIQADAPKVLWAMDFQSDSTVDGKAIKIASMIDEHTRQSLLNLMERSITAQRLTDELDKTFALWGGPPQVLRMDNGPEFISHVLQQLPRSCRYFLHSAGTPWNNGHIESFNNRLRKECLNRNHWTSLLEARVVIEDFEDDHNHRHRHSSLGYLTPAEYAAHCTHNHQPVEGCEID